MKLSILQIFAMVSILAFGCMTVAPFVQTTDAGEVHIILVIELDVYVCESCNAVIWEEVVGSYTKIITHDPDDPHDDMSSRIVMTIIPCGLCDSCEEEEETSS